MDDFLSNLSPFDPNGSLSNADADRIWNSYKLAGGGKDVSASLPTGGGLPSGDGGTNTVGNQGIFGMLSGMFGGATQPTPSSPNAPMQILPQVQQDGMSGQPSFLDTLKANLAKNGPQAFSGLAGQFMQKPAPVPPLPPINYPQPRQPPVYGSMVPRADYPNGARTMGIGDYTMPQMGIPSDYRTGR